MRFSKEEKNIWLSDWQTSGKSAWSYARANGLNPQTFTNWTKPKPESQRGFVEVPALTQAQQSTAEILIEKGDVRIHIPLSIGSMELRTIFGALRGSV